jgi:hypothetical protein
LFFSKILFDRPVRLEADDIHLKVFWQSGLSARPQLLNQRPVFGLGGDAHGCGRVLDRFIPQTDLNEQPCEAAMIDMGIRS